MRRGRGAKQVARSPGMMADMQARRQRMQRALHPAEPCQCLSARRLTLLLYDSCLLGD